VGGRDRTLAMQGAPMRGVHELVMRLIFFRPSPNVGEVCPKYVDKSDGSRSPDYRLLDFGDTVTVRSNARSPEIEFFQRAFETLRRKPSMP
jgi:hypothetical protein